MAEGGTVAAEALKLTSAADAVAEAEGVFSAPPLFVLLGVLAKLPADTRMRCAELNRAWRAAAETPSLWQRLDLTAERSPWASRRNFHGGNDVFMRAAAARACGLHTLHVACSHETSLEALLAVCATNAETLRNLSLEGSVSELHAYRGGRGYICDFVEVVAMLLESAPALEVLDMEGQGRDPGMYERFRSMLRHEPPFVPVRLRAARLFCFNKAGLDVRALFADLACHTSLKTLRIEAPLITVELDVAIDVIVNHLPLTELKLVSTFAADSGAPLARLVRSCATLTALELCASNGASFHADCTRVLADGLLENRSLTSLTLQPRLDWSVEGGSLPAVQHLLRALSRHPNLRALDVRLIRLHDLSWLDVVDNLVHLLEHDQLRSLSVGLHFNSGVDTLLYEAGLRQIFAAVGRNTRMRTLSLLLVQCNKIPTERCLWETVLPAVTACSTLQGLRGFRLVESLAGRAIGKLLASRVKGGSDAAQLATSSELGA